MAILFCMFGRPLAVRQPVFGDRGERLDHLGKFGRRVVLDLAALARLQIGRERLAAALHRPREIHREGFRRRMSFGLGLDRHVIHGEDTTFISTSSPRRINRRSWRVNFADLMCCTATRYLGSVILQPQRCASVAPALIVSGDNGLSACGKIRWNDAAYRCKAHTSRGLPDGCRWIDKGERWSWARCCRRRSRSAGCSSPIADMPSLARRLTRLRKPKEADAWLPVHDIPPDRDEP